MLGQQQQNERTFIMSSLNQVLLMGNLTRKPELRQTTSGRAVSDIGLATNRVYKDSQGNEIKDTVFLDIEVWGKTAENCTKYLDTGSPILVDGRLKLDKWEKDGQKHSKLKVVSNKITFMGSKKQSSQAPNTQPQNVYSPQINSNQNNQYQMNNPASGSIPTMPPPVAFNEQHYL